MSSGSESARYKRSYRNLLLDRQFQLKYTTLIMLAGGLIFGTMEFFFYDKVRTRSIHCDTRYMLWVMAEVDRAGNLLREMTIVP